MLKADHTDVCTHICVLDYISISCAIANTSCLQMETNTKNILCMNCASRCKQAEHGSEDTGEGSTSQRIRVRTGGGLWEDEDRDKKQKDKETAA